MNAEGMGLPIIWSDYASYGLFRAITGYATLIGRRRVVCGAGAEQRGLRLPGTFTRRWSGDSFGVILHRVNGGFEIGPRRGAFLPCLFTEVGGLGAGVDERFGHDGLLGFRWKGKGEAHQNGLGDVFHHSGSG